MIPNKKKQLREEKRSNINRQWRRKITNNSNNRLTKCKVNRIDSIWTSFASSNLASKIHIICFDPFVISFEMRANRFFCVCCDNTYRWIVLAVVIVLCSCLHFCMKFSVLFIPNDMSKLCVCVRLSFELCCA